MALFTEKQEALVKDSWEKVMKPNMSQLSLRFFTLIVEKAPEARNMFSFLKMNSTDGDDDEAEEEGEEDAITAAGNNPNNKLIKSHALIVFKLTCDSAIQLKEKGEVLVGRTTLKFLGDIHLQKGVTSPHFEVVKEALLQTVKEAMGERWNEEMNEAWGEAYDHLATAIKDEMMAQVSSPSP
ncbi:unnamed protein product [Cuscuta campestris]|uniref:Globin domain-containing protein n=1 Tax=Cuscuta campestris TaxID=132261 RepID=A0A484KEW9_9ASTE|nr:unnamed protein product [Cuscuta campestris]